MKKVIKNVLTILLFMSFVLGIKNNVYAVEQTRTITGKEVTSKELENSVYEKEFNENSEPIGTMRAFTIVDGEYDADYFTAFEPGGAEKGIIIESDYTNASFVFESANYVGENFTIKGLGTFIYDGYKKSLFFDNSFHIYKCLITSNEFKKGYKENTWFEILETDLKTGKTYLNELCLAFHKKVFLEDSNFGIKLEATTLTVPENVEMETKSIDNKEITILDEDKFIAYDITLKKEDEKIQPYKKVKVKIPIPKELDNSNLIAYRIEDGKKIPYEVEIQTINNEKYAIFKTDHFSTYVLAGNQKEVSEDKKESVNELPKQEITDTELKKEENNKHILDNEPKTGIINVISIVSVIVAVSFIGFAICKKKMYK